MSDAAVDELANGHVTIQPPTPTVTTDIHDATHNVVTAVRVGPTVHDLVTVAGGPNKPVPISRRRRYARRAVAPRLAMLSILAAGVCVAASGCGSGGENGSSPTLKSNQSLLAFSAVEDSNRDIFMLEAPGGKPKALAKSKGDDISPSWSPGGQNLAFASARAGTFDIWRMRADGSGLTRLTNKAYDEVGPEWSPDGRSIVYVGLGGNYDLYTMRADGTGKKQLTSDLSNDLEPQWSPDSRRIAFVRVCLADFCRPKPADGPGDIYVIGAGGQQQRRLTQTPAADSDPRWSPDGRTIAFVSAQGKRSGIWSVRPNGSGLRELTRSSAADTDPQWSPDGRRIAFVRKRGNNGDIYVMKANGTGLRDLTGNPADDSAPRWSADGRRIFFVSDRKTKGEIYVMNGDGTNVSLVAEVEAADGDLTVARKPYERGSGPRR